MVVVVGVEVVARDTKSSRRRRSWILSPLKGWAVNSGSFGGWWFLRGLFSERTVLGRA